MSRHDSFRPAIDSPGTRTIARVLLPLALRRRAVERIEIGRADLKRLRALRKERVVLTPNHPTNTDPALIFELSRRAGMSFHYLCTREAFDAWGGLWGALVQRLGAYSVVRGTIDRESFRYTRELLARPAAKLVIFPEGEVYSQNDSLLPFQVGAIQLAEWGREEARKRDPDAQVYLLPCAVRYRFVSDVRPALEGKLARLEKTLDVPVSGDLYARLRRVSLAVLESVEHQYHLKPSPGEDWTPRFEAAREVALARAAKLLDAPMPRGTLPEKMRTLMHLAEERMQDNETGDDPKVQRRAERHRAARVRLAWNDLRRLANWIAIYDGYVRQTPTMEHIAEVVARLEIEVDGHASQPGPRIATVRVGEPIALPEDIKRRDLPRLTLQLEEAVAALLGPDARRLGDGKQTAGSR